MSLGEVMAEAALRDSQLEGLLGREGGVDNKGKESEREWKGTPWDSVWDGARGSAWNVARDSTREDLGDPYLEQARQLAVVQPFHAEQGVIVCARRSVVCSAS